MPKKQPGRAYKPIPHISAISGLQRSSPVYSIIVECSVKSSEDCWLSSCVLNEFDATKSQGYRCAIRDGWTYNENGEWVCEECKERKEQG